MIIACTCHMLLQNHEATRITLTGITKRKMVCKRQSLFGHCVSQYGKQNPCPEFASWFYLFLNAPAGDTVKHRVCCAPPAPSDVAAIQRWGSTDWTDLAKQADEGRERASRLRCTSRTEGEPHDSLNVGAGPCCLPSGESSFLLLS